MSGAAIRALLNQLARCDAFLGRILNLGMPFSPECTVWEQLPGNGLLHPFVITLWSVMPIGRAGTQQAELTDENHRHDRIVRLCSKHR
jgi:hypothetical protein